MPDNDDFEAIVGGSDEDMPEERRAYRERRAADSQVEQRMLDVVGDTVKGSGWDDPEGILVDAVVIMLFKDRDGDFGVTWMNAGSDQQAEGLMRRCVRQMELMDTYDFNRRRGATD